MNYAENSEIDNKGEKAVYHVMSRTALDGYVLGGGEVGDRRIMLFIINNFCITFDKAKCNTPICLNCDSPNSFSFTL